MIWVLEVGVSTSLCYPTFPVEGMLFPLPSSFKDGSTDAGVQLGWIRLGWRPIQA